MSDLPPPPPNTPPPPPGYVPYGASASGPASPSGQPLADGGMRIVARLIDFVIGIVIGLIIAAAVISNGSAGFGGLGGSASSGDRIKVWLFGAIFGFLYEAVTTKLAGGTPGKLMLGFKVVRADNGGPVSWVHAVLRWLTIAIWGVLGTIGGLISLVIWIVSIVFLFSDKLRQTVADKVAKTLVVKTR